MLHPDLPMETKQKTMKRNTNMDMEESEPEDTEAAEAPLALPSLGSSVHVGALRQAREQGLSPSCPSRWGCYANEHNMFKGKEGEPGTERQEDSELPAKKAACLSKIIRRTFLKGKCFCSFAKDQCLSA